MNGSNALQTRYMRGNLVDQVFARLDSNDNAYWLLTDHLGSIVTVTDNSGNVKDQVTYDGWGNATQTHSSYGGRYLWTGREADVETGLQYNRARYYDTQTGRWISQDPLGFRAGDVNLSRYVANHPTEGTDATGLDSGPEGPPFFPPQFSRTPSFGFVLNSGLFGNLGDPFFVSSGRFRSWANGAISTVKITARSGATHGSCNTIFSNIIGTNFPSGGGFGIQMDHFQPGKYRVRLGMFLDLRNEFPTAGSVSATISAYGSGKALFQGTTGRNNRSFIDSKDATVSVAVGQDGTASLAFFNPNIATSGSCGWGRATGAIRIISYVEPGGRTVVLQNPAPKVFP
jgi:RHS repeat-associated protein